MTSRRPGSPLCCSSCCGGSLNTKGSGLKGVLRVHVWNLIKTRHGQIPLARPVGQDDLGHTVVICLDATITIAQSDLEQAAGTFKGTFGHYALTAWPLPAGQKATNTTHARGREPGNTANAQLKNWRILRKICYIPHRATDLVNAVQNLLLAG